MEKLYNIDFVALSRTEKAKLIHNFAEIAEESFSEYPFEVAVNAQLLIFTRWWNSYRLMLSENPTPQIFECIFQHLWDYQEGKMERSEFVQFSKCLDASVLEIAIGDSEKLYEDKAYYDFLEKNFEDWEPLYDEFIIDLTYVCYGISEHEMLWTNVESILYGDIADIRIPLLEGMEETYRMEEIYSTDRFCQVIALLQKDMKTAVEGRPIAELRAIYQNEYLFSPEDVTKILRWINCAKTDGYEQ